MYSAFTLVAAHGPRENTPGGYWTMLTMLAYLLLIAVLAVVGISMSAHSATPNSHTTSTLSTASEHASEEPHRHSLSGSSAPAVNAGEAACVDCAEDHFGLLMACAFLALLLVVTFLFPALALRLGIIPPRVAVAEEPTRGTVSARPPDLAELCISRQ